jgi:hypothetical protein
MFIGITHSSFSPTETFFKTTDDISLNQSPPPVDKTTEDVEAHLDP